MSVRINGEIISTRLVPLSKIPSGSIIQVGKRKFLKIIWKEDEKTYNRYAYGEGGNQCASS